MPGRDVLGSAHSDALGGARWEMATTPNVFIPLAERLGLLNQILWGTLDQALPFIRGTDRTLAVNISPSHLLSAMVSFLKKMNLRCCVEGVEAEAIESFVTDLGCEEVQGYLIGKPALFTTA